MSPRRHHAITARDQELLEFLARHRLVRTDHARRLLEVSEGPARARLRRLHDAGLVTRDIAFEGQPECWQITRDGLGAISSPLPVPRRDLSTHTHDVGVAWLWLAARGGAFGELREVISERELRSRDGLGRRSDPRLAVRVAGLGPRGGEQLHYPDLLLTSARGDRVALELELTTKSRPRRERILEAYAGEPAIDHVVYLVHDRRIGREIARSARRLGLSDMIHVRRVTLPDPTQTPPAATRVLRRTQGRDGGDVAR